MKSFKWWRNEANREAAKSIAEILQIVVPAFAVVGIALAGWFGYKSTEIPAAETTQGDNSTYQKGDGLNFAINVPQTFNSGLTIEQHQAILEKREADLRSDLARASASEKALILQQLDVVASKLSDIQASYEQSLEDLRLLRERLKEFEGQVPAEQLQAAQEAVYRGDTDSADKLFADLEKSLEDQVILASKAAFGRGQIAETEIRWHDAASHFATAAKLNPTFDTLFKAREYAWRAGNNSAAFGFGAELLEWAKTQGTQEQLSVALNEHALTLKKQGQYPQAEALYRQALEIDRATIGEAHQNYAASLNNLAGVVQAQERLDEAEGLFRQALEIDRATIGDAHPDHAIHLNNLALVAAAQGRLDEAEGLYRQALEIDRATIGESHPDYATHLNNFGVNSFKQGKLDAARDHLLAALAIRRARLGDGHPDTQRSIRRVLHVLTTHFPDDPQIPVLTALLAPTPTPENPAKP